jgi:hypothetical protein
MQGKLEHTPTYTQASSATKELKHAQVRSSAPRVRSSALIQPSNAETLFKQYKYHSFYCKRMEAGQEALFFVISCFLGFCNSEHQFFCKFLGLDEVN